MSLAGAEGWWARRFTDERTGTQLQVILLSGRPGPISVHRPETCYAAAGYGLVAPPIRYTLRSGAGTNPPAEFWVGDYRQPEVGGQGLRIFYSWYGDGAWSAADNPRWTFARLPALYKLYVIRDEDGRGERLDDDPAADFLRRPSAGAVALPFGAVTPPPPARPPPARTIVVWRSAPAL